VEKSKEERDDIKVKGPISVKAEESKIIVEIGEEKKPKPPKKDAPGTKILLCFLAIALLIFAVNDGGIGFKPRHDNNYQPSYPSQP
jgi:hypothetical protein